MKKNTLLVALFFAFVSLQAQQKINVYVFVAEECPISIYMAHPLKESFKSYSDQVSFTAVFPKKNSTMESAGKFLTDYGLDAFKIMLDQNQSFSKATEATITPEAVITDVNGKILYRGRISDAYRAPGKMKHGPRSNELSSALQDILAGKTVQHWEPAVGCYITFHNS